MNTLVIRHGLAPAQGVRLMTTFTKTYVLGALDLALGGGASNAPLGRSGQRTHG